ncbi:MAG: hypothetical protein Q8904_07655 [Bacteroidota bacterium]|nr:hypothetical protein [Bacteroidota bacterium]
MKKKIFILLFLLEISNLGIYSQKCDTVTVNSEYPKCINKTILATLNNIPAYIQKGCYNYFNKVDSFSIVLLNQPDVNYYIREIYPIGQVPKEFQRNNLYVLISGNILDYKKTNNCVPVSHNSDYLGTNMFELELIKINEQGECSRCNDTTILAILKDEPAFIHRGCLFESNLFYIELIKKPEINQYISKWIYPCCGIPEKFQIDGLSVLVSGNILRCGKYNPCFPSKPNIRIAPTNFFELKNIKIASK